MPGSVTDSDSELRIDRWLWFARFYKTRTLAARAVVGGHVRVNGERARAGQRVRRGDTVELVKKQLPWKFEVLDVPRHRGPASEAQTCYREDDAVRARRRDLSEQLKSDRQRMPRTDGRPDKHTRRLLRERNRSG